MPFNSAIGSVEAESWSGCRVAGGRGSGAPEPVGVGSERVGARCAWFALWRVTYSLGGTSRLLNLTSQELLSTTKGNFNSSFEPRTVISSSSFPISSTSTSFAVQPWGSSTTTLSVSPTCSIAYGVGSRSDMLGLAVSAVARGTHNN
eukprot:9471873-Pyramimonas_sp.AAC.1